jgi:hypothetical protein
MRSLLLPGLSRAFFLGLHTTSRATCGRSRSYNQAAVVPSSKVTDKVPRSPAKELEDGGSFGFQDAFHDQLARVVQHSDCDGCLMDIEANILFRVHEGAPFCRLMMLALITYSRGAPFYNAFASLDWRVENALRLKDIQPIR